MSWLKPRSIRGQLISGLICVFKGPPGDCIRQSPADAQKHPPPRFTNGLVLRLESEVDLLALQSQAPLTQAQAGYLEPILRTMINSPSIRAAMVTDTNGRIIASSDPLYQWHGPADAAGKKGNDGQVGGGEFSRSRGESVKRCRLSTSAANSADFLGL